MPPNPFPYSRRSVLIGVETYAKRILATSVEITREQGPELVLSEAEGLQLGLKRSAPVGVPVLLLEGTNVIIPQTETSWHMRGIQVFLVKECRKAAWGIAGDGAEAKRKRRA